MLRSDSLLANLLEQRKVFPVFDVEHQRPVLCPVLRTGILVEEGEQLLLDFFDEFFNLLLGKSHDVLVGYFRRPLDEMLLRRKNET